MVLPICNNWWLLVDILGEVCALFPFEYIHLGGDEAPKKGWEKCPQCQARIRAEGLANENELQAYFMHRLEKFVNSRGKRMIGWDEIMEGGLSPTATVMSWRGVLPGLEAARGGNDVVMAPGSYLYLNHPQSYNRVTNTSEGILSLKRVYGFDPRARSRSYTRSPRPYSGRTGLPMVGMHTQRADPLLQGVSPRHCRGGDGLDGSGRPQLGGFPGSPQASPRAAHPLRHSVRSTQPRVADRAGP